MKDPAFLFYTSDFLGGIADLTMEERGQYITMLCFQHLKGSVSEKTIRLNLGSVSVCVLDKFIRDENGELYNKRLREEIVKRNNFTESRRNNGIKGGRPKENKKPKGKPKQNHKDNLMEDVNINENNNINDNIKTPLEKAFLNFIEHRKQLKKPVTKIQEQALKNKIWELSGQSENIAIKIIEQSIANGWQGIFKLKNENGKQQEERISDRIRAKYSSQEF